PRHSADHFRCLDRAIAGGVFSAAAFPTGRSRLSAASGTSCRPACAADLALKVADRVRGQQAQARPDWAGLSCIETKRLTSRGSPLAAAPLRRGALQGQKTRLLQRWLRPRRPDL